MTSLSVLQYNIFFGKLETDTDFDILNRITLLCDQIKDLNPDVVCMQEVTPNRYARIVAGLDTYPYRYPDRILQSYDTAILSKYPIIDKGKAEYSASQMRRSIMYVTIYKSNRKICIATSHFESEFGARFADMSTKLIQYAEAEDMLDRISTDTKSTSIVFCADFNSNNKLCDDTLYKSFKFSSDSPIDKNWRDAWIESGIDQNSIFTYDSYSNPMLLAMSTDKKYRSRLDRILHKSDLYVSKFQMIKSDLLISDHYPLIIHFSQDRPDKYIGYAECLSILSTLNTVDEQNRQKNRSNVPYRFPKNMFGSYGSNSGTFSPPKN